MVTNNKILFSLYGRYLVMDLDCDGTLQAKEVHAPLVDHKLLTLFHYTYMMQYTARAKYVP